MIPAPVDPLLGWNTGAELPHSLLSRLVAVPSIANPASYALPVPERRGGGGVRACGGGTHVVASADAPSRISRSSTRARSLRSPRSIAWRSVGAYEPAVTYPNNGFALALRTVAGALSTRSARACSGCRPAATIRTPQPQGGTYATLMTTLNDGLLAFYQDLSNQGLLNDTLVLQFSEFGRRIMRERQRRHRSRRRQRDDGDWRPGARRHLRHGAIAVARSRQPDAREQRRTTCGTKPTSARSMRASSTAGSAPTRPPFSAATSAAGRSSSESLELTRLQV